ncbi:MAG: ABC transporter permease subunit [Oculatellaceae cyanobacterium Prado106]|jgi:general L-amino acid transport system permease protein|nr:ABC transporter permease subunit [Oculatellaceae cyanobacterium Prado106]
MSLSSESPDSKIPFWRDERYVKIALQAIAVLVVFIVFSLLVGNLNRNLQQSGRQFDFSFLWNEAGFNIGESLLTYAPRDRYIWAIFVGLVNSLQVMLSGFVLTTILGTIAGIASFSENWLVRKLSQVYVELVRNTPLLLQLFFWYLAVFLGLSKTELKPILGFFYVSNRGLSLPWPANTPMAWIGLGLLILGAIAAFIIWQWRTKIMVEQGASGKSQLFMLIGIGIAALLILTIGLGWQFPSVVAGAVSGGMQLSLEFSALLIGLVFYTGAFIAEIVRAGIQSVSRGQWEAARALGLQSSLAMRLVVFPQALRVIIPSLNSQYMNLAKNSSLALAIGFPDVYAVSNTTFNQTGRPVEVFLMLMAIYLTINLIISTIMNTLNRAVQIKER